MTKWRTQIAAGCLIAVAATAWIGAASAQTLRIGLAEDPDILDPTLARTYVGRIVFAALCDKLVDIAPELDIVPQLATEWQWTDGNKALVMKLRPGVKFQDGEPFDAAAVKFSIERHLTCRAPTARPRSAPSQASRSSTTIPSSSCCRRRSRRCLAQLSDRAGMIVSPKAAQAAGEISASTRSAPARTNSSSASRRTASCSNALPITGTRTRCISTASSICRSRTRQCGSPICNRAGSI